MSSPTAPCRKCFDDLNVPKTPNTAGAETRPPLNVRNYDERSPIHHKIRSLNLVGVHGTALLHKV